LQIHESAENYLETILMLQAKLGLVRSIDIVNELNFAKPSVSVAMKKLRENNYIEVDRKGHIYLTELGLDVAKTMYERHKILSEFLISLGVNEESAKEDACRIEHVISKESFEKMKEHYFRTCHKSG